MGISSACAIFERFSTGLQYIAQHKLNIPFIIHILGDFLIMGPPNTPLSQLCLYRFLGFCASVAIPIKVEKIENARTVIIFMGFELDSVKMEGSLPQDKLAKLRSQLCLISRCRKCLLRDLQSLLWLLNFCCQVVVPGRPFMHRLTDLTVKAKKPHHHITFNRESRRDIVQPGSFSRIISVSKTFIPNNDGS